jgi:hypothetical protein
MIMKFHWGHGLLIAIILGVSGILLLVFLSSRERIDLITEDYYPKGINYQQQIEKIKNSSALKQGISLKVSDSLLISFPRVVSSPDSIRGEIWIYSAADKFADMKMMINLNDSYSQSIDIRNLHLAKYELIIDWEAEGKAYLHKELFFP